MTSLADIILEIGEATSKPYQLREVSTSGDANLKGFVTTIYYFDIDDYKEGDPSGKVELDYETLGNERGRLDIAFDVETDSQEERFDSTNLGIKVMNRVMSTVVQAVREFKRDHVKDNSITNITFNAEEGKSTGVKGDTRGSRIRKMLYLRYIETFFDIENQKSFGNQIQIQGKFKDNINESVIKSLSLGALLGLSALSGMTDDAKAQTQHRNS